MVANFLLSDDSLEKIKRCVCHSLKFKDKNILYQLFVFASQGMTRMITRGVPLQFRQHYYLHIAYAIK
jgi:hypothetical protein